MTTLRTNYQEGEILHASDINSTNAEVNAKSTVSVSGSGTATDEVSYITVNGVEKKIAGGGGSVDIFIAEYDVTPWQDIVDAIDDGKAVFCKYAEEGDPPTYASLYNANIDNGECMFSAVAIASSDEEVSEYMSAFILVTLDDTETIWANYPASGIIPTKTSELANDSNFAVLPNKVNDRYLHTNASTGALEWTQVSSSGGGIFVAQYGETTWQTVSQHLDNGDMVYVSHSGILHGYVMSTSQARLFTGIVAGEDSAMCISTVYVTSTGGWNELANIEFPAIVNNRFLHTNASTGALEWVEGTGGLPTTVNDRYLHTNASTGALEWVEGSGGGGTDANAVHYTADSNKTAEQKAQARSNIGAQEALVSGTNIKTINGTSVLGSGGITIPDKVFIATYDTTTYAEVTSALNAGKLVVCYDDDSKGYLVLLGKNSQTGYLFGQIIRTAVGSAHYAAYSTATLNSSNQWSWTSNMLATSDLVNDSNFASLPSTVNNRYLHTNAVTGALEWASMDDSSIFIAEASGDNPSTYEDVVTAFESGKICFAKDSDGYYPLIIPADPIVFGIFTPYDDGDGTKAIYVQLLLGSDDTWTVDDGTLSTSMLTNDSGFASLPTTVNDRYLHTNATTGALEWTTVSGGGEPSAYLKNASVNGNTLTLTKKDDSTVTFTPSGGLPAGTAASNALIYNGTNWIQQDGYGYIEAENFFSGTLSLTKGEEGVYYDSFEKTSAYEIDKDTEYVITVNNAEYIVRPEYTYAPESESEIYGYRIGAKYDDYNGTFDFTFCPVSIIGWFNEDENKYYWGASSKSSSVTVTIKKRITHTIDGKLLENKPASFGTFYNRNIATTEYSTDLRAYSCNANFYKINVKLLYGKNYTFNFNGTNYTPPLNYTSIDIMEYDDDLQEYVFVRRESILYYGEITKLYQGDDEKGWRPNFTNYPFCLVIGGSSVDTEEQLSIYGTYYDFDSRYMNLLTYESDYTISITGEYREWVNTSRDTYTIIQGTTKPDEMTYAITFNNYLDFPLNRFYRYGIVGDALVFHQLNFYEESETLIVSRVYYKFDDSGMEEGSDYGWGTSDGFEEHFLPSYSSEETGKKLVLEDGVPTWVNDSSGGSATWGSITGTLSSQTDLQTALNAKQNTLPTVINDRYLHTNASTGALEWTTVSGGNNIFIAEYNTTSYQDIINAINANKVVLCKYSFNGSSIYAPTGSHIRYARLCDINNNAYVFSTIIPEESEDAREVYLDSNYIRVSLNGTQTQWEEYVNLRIIPRMTSHLINDSNFITSSYHDSTKQNTLVSGTNIKTINNQSILGSGNINISGGASNVMIAIFDDTAVSDIEVAYDAGKTIMVKDYFYDEEEAWTDNYGRMAYLSDVEYYEEEEEVEEGEYETVECMRFYFTQVSGKERKTYVYTIDTYEDYWYREQM